MLRELKVQHKGGRLYACTVTTTNAPSAVYNTGGDNYASISRSAAGTPVLTLKQPYSRNMVAVGCVVDNSVNGLYSSQGATPSGSSCTMVMNNAASTNVDDTCNVLQVGFMSSDVSRTSSQNIESCYRKTRIIWGKITGASGAVAIGTGDFTCTRTSTGLYTIGYKNAFAKSAYAFAYPISSASNRAATIGIQSASGCTVKTADNSPTVQDTDFYIIVVGQDIRDEHGLAFGRVQNSQRRPRVVAGQLTVTAGTPTFSINGSSFSSVTDNGVGDFSLNLIQPFARECAVIACANNCKSLVHTGSATAPRIRCITGGGAAFDPTTVDFILIGSDDVSEY